MSVAVVEVAKRFELIIEAEYDTLVAAAEALAADARHLKSYLEDQLMEPEQTSAD